ncbi:MAG: bifunctional adenosylcobinamide kinase/adenosylcobinamide-phosphate guanylyltransferase [Chloroflexota bacterium]
MKSRTLILGGARSGKSSYAEKLAAEAGPNVLYVATAEAKDDDMAERIANHQRERPASWQTIETPLAVSPALESLSQAPDLILLDCLTLLVSNILLSLEEEPQAVIEQHIAQEISAIIAAQERLNTALIIVSNEVGLGLVPPYPLGRIYRDLLGRANQQLAAQADQVLFMVAGLPMTVKG